MKAEYAVTAERQIQLTIRAPSSPDLIARLLEAVRTQASGVRTHCAFQNQHQTVVMMVPGDVQRAVQALESIGHGCQATPVVLVAMPYRVGVVAGLNEIAGVAAPAPRAMRRAAAPKRAPQTAHHAHSS